MLNIFRLRLGASLHFLIAMGHLICLFFLEEAFKAYGILDEMKHNCQLTIGIRNYVVN